MVVVFIYRLINSVFVEKKEKEKGNVVGTCVHFVWLVGR